MPPQTPSREPLNTLFIKTTFYIATILLFSCGHDAVKTNTTLQNDISIPFILDSLATPDKGFQTGEMQAPINDIFYKGTISDTINLSGYARYENDNYLNFQGYSDNSTVVQALKLYVSNKQLLAIDLEAISIPPPPIHIEKSDGFELDSIATVKTYEVWKQRPRNYIQAIPVFIHNPTKDTLLLDQQDGRVIMIQEAKDENGQWKPIEFWRYSWCGNSYGAEVLLPNTVAIVKIFKYEGDFETEIRLKLKNGNDIIYSDSFKGKINKSQFNLPRDVKEIYLSRKNENKEYLDRIFLNK